MGKESRTINLGEVVAKRQAGNCVLIANRSFHCRARPAQVESTPE